MKTPNITTQKLTDYNRIAGAIHYIRQHYREQPALETIAETVQLSPFHFQKLFTEWAGVSPKKFLQYISLSHAKKLLRENKATLFDAAYETGLSGTSRLHDLFVSIEGMTPGEYKNGGEDLSINYSYAESRFGNILVASTPKGICHLAFAEERNEALQALQDRFPRATYRQMTDLAQQNALHIFKDDWSRPERIKLHLKGSDFQLKVWESLLKIPAGRLATYGDIASYIQRPGASRAVGGAVGDNPVAFLIPCHRVIQASGALGGYMWGPVRKTAIIGWEAAKTGG